MMTRILNYMRRLGALIWVYLDDWLLIGATRESACFLAQELVSLWTSCGIQIAANKGNLQPSQIVQYLCFTINLLQGLLSVPSHKLKSVSRRLKDVLRNATLTPRTLPSTVGAVSALAPAVPYVRLLTHTLRANLSVAQRYGWETKRTLPNITIRQVESTVQELRQWHSRSFHLQLPE